MQPHDFFDLRLNAVCPVELFKQLGTIEKVRVLEGELGRIVVQLETVHDNTMAVSKKVQLEAELSRLGTLKEAISVYLWEAFVAHYPHIPEDHSSSTQPVDAFLVEDLSQVETFAARGRVRALSGELNQVVVELETARDNTQVMSKSAQCTDELTRLWSLRRALNQYCLASFAAEHPLTALCVPSSTTLN